MEETQLANIKKDRQKDIDFLRKEYSRRIGHVKSRSTKTAMVNVLVSLYLNYGVIQDACISSSIGRSTFYMWKNTYNEFYELVQEIEESFLDQAEGKIRSKIEEGDTACLIFYLKTKGRSRGYNEKVEIDTTIVDKSMKEMSNEELERNAGIIS